MLLEALQTRQLYEDLVVVFLSDHGEGLYQHGILGHGWDLHREAIQIPLILRVPGLARGQRIEDPVQQIDLLPTLLDLLAIDDSESHQGRSLKPLLEGSYSEEDSDTPLLAYLDYEGRKGMSLILGPWKLIEPLSSSFSSGRQLFHRVRDPDERTNLASEYPVLAGYMATRVRAELLEFEKLSEPERMEFDEQTREELRALGYLQ